MALAVPAPSPLAVDIARPSAPEPPATPSPLAHRPFLPTACSPPPSRPSSPPLPLSVTPTPSTSTPASTAPGTPSTSPPPSTSTCSSASSRASLAPPAGSGSNMGRSKDSAETLNVKFAPLPQLAPRRRRSTAPLGMAARGSLMGGRRGPAAAAAEAGMALAVATRAEADADAEMMTLAELRWRQEEAAARYAHFQASAHAEMTRATEAEIAREEAAREAKALQRAIVKGKNGDLEDERIRLKEKRREYEHDAAEDPLLSLGKAVKGVGRHFWRRRTPSGVARAESPTAFPALGHKKSSDAPLRPILATIATNTGSRPENVGGTQSVQVADHDAVKITDSPTELHQESERASTSTPTPSSDETWAVALVDDIPSDIGQTETMLAGRAAKPTVEDAEGT